MAWSEWKNVGDFAYQRNKNYYTFKMTATSSGTGKLMVVIASGSPNATYKIYKNGVQIGSILRQTAYYGADAVIDVTFSSGDVFTVDNPGASGIASMFLVSN